MSAVPVVCPRMLCWIRGHRHHVIGPDVTLCFRCGLVGDHSPRAKSVDERRAHLRTLERLQKVARAHNLTLHD